MNADKIDAVLAQHPTWGFRILKGEVTCTGPICEWAAKPTLKQPAADVFRQHQADMIAAAMPEPAPWGTRDDLTVFAALLAKLGGETTVTMAEADRVTGVHVTRWDEPHLQQYRFTLDVPEFRDMPVKAITTDPTHTCESFMIRRNIDGGRYCAACGATQ